jgi:putative endonuclease
MGLSGHTWLASVPRMSITHPFPSGSKPGQATSDPGGAGPPARHGDPRRALGRRGEQLAAQHLQRLGFAPLACNQRTRYGEIDLIAFDGRTLVFAEVKTRRANVGPRGSRQGQQPLAGLRPRQRARLRRLATAWLADAEQARPTARTIRFDAIGVTLDSRCRLLRLDHLEGAW